MRRLTRASSSTSGGWLRKCDLSKWRNDVEPGTKFQALDQVRVGDVEPAERDQISEIAAARLRCELEIITVVRDMETVERPMEALQIETVRNFARSLRHSLNNVDVRQLERIQPINDIRVGRLRIAVEPAAVDRAQR
jgi:hypothetical protein